MSSAERFTDKVVLVTGGASGIGLAATRRFVSEGARVMVADLDTDRLAAVEAEMGKAVAVRHCDVRSERDVEEAVAETLARFGRLDVAFANAGIGSATALGDLDPAEWMRVMEVNVLGPALTIKHAAVHLPRGGSVVITASLNAVQPAAGMSAYCCSKAAVAMLAEVAAMELGPRGIRVNAVGPGLVRTALTDAIWMVPSIVEEFVENAPLGSHPTPDDIANLVAFLASDDAAMITGTLQLVDGGAHTKRYPDVMANAARAAAGG